MEKITRIKASRLLQSACPYWDEASKQDCKMVKGGLYIPMPEHIDIFCSTIHFSQCHQYIRGCEILNETAQRLGFTKEENGRRQYRRMTEQLLLAVSTCDEKGKPTVSFEEPFKTIDISLGGLRIESKEEIQANEIIAFTFGDDFAIPGFTGFGEVKWSRKITDGKNFQSGLAFLNNSPRQAIGNHLGLPV